MYVEGISTSPFSSSGCLMHIQTVTKRKRMANAPTQVAITSQFGGIPLLEVGHGVVGVGSERARRRRNKNMSALKKFGDGDGEEME